MEIRSLPYIGMKNGVAMPTPETVLSSNPKPFIHIPLLERAELEICNAHKRGPLRRDPNRCSDQSYQ